MARVLVVGEGPDRLGGVAACTRLIMAIDAKSGYKFVSVDICGPLKGLFGVVRFVHLLLFTKVDLVHLQVASKGSLFRKAALATFARLRGRPVLSHIHGGDLIDFVRRSQPAHKVMGYLFRRSACIIVLGSFYEAEVLARWPSVKDRLVVIPNGVAEVGTSEAKLDQILFAGLVGDNKRTFDLVSAFSKANVHGWKLKILGPGRNRELRELVDELKVSESVDILGPCAPNIVFAEMQVSRMFVLPSRSEGLPMSILEAMSSWLPIVATDVGAVSDAVKPRVNGELLDSSWTVFEMADLLTKWTDSEHSAKLEVMGVKSHELWAANFSTSAFCIKLVNVYSEVLAQ